MVVTMLSNTAFATNTNDHAQMIAKTFNQFRYSMTVDANATDANFQARAIENFKARMKVLQDNGVSPAEIMSYMRGNILDASTRNDFDRMMLSMNMDQVSSEDAGNLAMQFMASKYQQGASYSGGGKANMKVAAIVIGVVIVGVVTYLVVKYVKDNKNKADKTVTKTDTTTETKTTTETQTSTVTDVQTQTNTVTDTSTVTNTETQINTQTIVNTQTLTQILTNTVTNVFTNTVTLTNTTTATLTNTVTNTVTQTNTNTNTHNHCSHGYNYGNCTHNGCSYHHR